MSCLRLEQVYLYLEGELDDADRRRLERHLEICAGCRRAVEERKILHEASLTLPPVEIPPDFAKKVLGRIPARRASDLAWFAVFASATGALSLAALGVGLLLGVRFPGFLVLLTRSLWSLLGRAGATLGKLLGILRAGSDLAGEFFGGLWKVADAFAGTVLPGGTAVPALLLGLVLSFLLILGMRRFLFNGEKT